MTYHTHNNNRSNDGYYNDYKRQNYIQQTDTPPINDNPAFFTNKVKLAILTLLILFGLGAYGVSKLMEMLGI